MRDFAMICQSIKHCQVLPMLCQESLKVIEYCQVLPKLLNCIKFLPKLLNFANVVFKFYYVLLKLLNLIKIIWNNQHYEVLPILCKVLPRFAKAIEYCQVLQMLFEILPSFGKFIVKFCHYCVRFCQDLPKLLNIAKFC
jgi:hypothetical protein